MSGPEEKVLNYGDVCLRRLDVNLLWDPTAWLNDQLINFYFEFLSRETFLQAGLLLMPGSSTFLLAQLGPDASAVLLEPLGFAAASLVLFAVNNNPDVDAWGGGSHWTLLAYSAADNTFRHYDSMAGTNRAAAAAVFRAVARPGSHLVETATPQQQNGHDCGLYVLALARLLCQRHAAAAAAGGGAELMSFEADGEVNSAGVAALRQELLDLVCRKMAAAAGT